jgi:hypothetical protein
VTKLNRINQSIVGVAPSACIYPSITRHGGGRRRSRRRWDRGTTPLPVDGDANHKAMLSIEQEAHIVVIVDFIFVVIFVVNNNSNRRIYCYFYRYPYRYNYNGSEQQ